MSNLSKYNQTIKHYYDSSQLLYRIFVYNTNTLGMHHGFWDGKTKSRQEAMENENQAIIDAVNIKSSDIVLDAGCGVGGSAIYIAKKTGAKVTGITLSQNQVNLAEKYALKHGVSHLTDFQVQDYTKTNFSDNSFDVIYGVESICHAFPKIAFLKEAFRMLKPGGRIVIADGYSRRKPENKKEEETVKDFTSAFALKELIISDYMTKALLKTGFIDVQAEDKLDLVKPSVKYFYLLAFLSKPIVKLFALFPLMVFKVLDQNWLALYAEGMLLKTGIFAYYLHHARKPK